MPPSPKLVLGPNSKPALMVGSEVEIEKSGKRSAGQANARRTRGECFCRVGVSPQARETHMPFPRQVGREDDGVREGNHLAPSGKLLGKAEQRTNGDQKDCWWDCSECNISQPGGLWRLQQNLTPAIPWFTVGGVLGPCTMAS